MSNSSRESLRDRVRACTDDFEGLEVLDHEATETIVRAASIRHLMRDLPYPVMRGIPGLSVWSWPQEPGFRAELLESLTTNVEDVVTVIFWRRTERAAARGQCPDIYAMVDELDDVPFMLVGPGEGWILLDIRGRLAVHGPIRRGAASITQHFGWATVIGVAVAGITFGAACVEFGLPAPQTALSPWLFSPVDAMLGAMFAGGMAWCLSFYLFRRPRPSILPLRAQLTVGITVSVLASLFVAFLLAMAYDLHTQPSGH